MGLLDAIGSDQGGGGLLDALLRSLQQNSDPSQMAQMGPQPSDQAQYAPPMQPAPVMAQPSPMDNARWPVGPVGAPSQAMAQGGPPVAPPGAGGNVPPPQTVAPPPASGPAMFAQPQPAQDPGMSLGDRLGAGFRGMVANAPAGPLGAIFGGIAGVAGMGKGTAEAQEAKKLGYAANALLQKGVDPATVQAAVNNPEIMKTLITQHFGQGAYTQETDKDGNVWNVNQQTGQKTVALQAKDDKFQPVKTKDALGNETSQSFNSKTGEYSGAPAGGVAGAVPGFSSVLAQGVQYDPNKTGDAYLAQFSPEVQAATKAYINGDVMPTGNARNNSIATFAKTVAQKYGMDTGAPVTDATYGAKRKMQTDLASSGNSTMGGILSNGESSFKHLAEYTASAADQGNASHNFIGGGMLAHAQNYIGNTGGGSDTQGKVKAINDNLGKYGAESTKFYAGTGGGVEERLNALKEMNATTTSGEEAASYAEKEKGLMLDRLNTKFQEIRNTLGEERGNAEIAKHMPDIQKNIATIDANLARLRGAAPAAASKAATVTQNGHTYNLQPDGTYK